MPGSSSTRASLDLERRLKRVDFPTLGRPTMTTTEPVTRRFPPWEAVGKPPSAALSSSRVTAAYFYVRLIPRDVGCLASKDFPTASNGDSISTYSWVLSITASGSGVPFSRTQDPVSRNTYSDIMARFSRSNKDKCRSSGGSSRKKPKEGPADTS